MWLLKYNKPKLGEEAWVAGFTKSHQVVCWTSDIRLAKRFNTLMDVKRFLSEHCDCGHGLSKEDVDYISIS